MNYKFVKKPIEVEAFQLTDHALSSNEHWPDWLHEAWNKLSGSLGSMYPTRAFEKAGTLSIMTLEGEMIVSLDDWIIKGIKGELYPCKPDIFEATYSSSESMAVSTTP